MCKCRCPRMTIDLPEPDALPVRNHLGTTQYIFIKSPKNHELVAEFGTSTHVFLEVVAAFYTCITWLIERAMVTLVLRGVRTALAVARPKAGDNLTLHRATPHHRCTSTRHAGTFTATIYQRCLVARDALGALWRQRRGFIPASSKCPNLI